MALLFEEKKISMSTLKIVVPPAISIPGAASDC